MPGAIAATINGHRYSYASISVQVNGILYAGIRSINYSTALTPGIIMGSDSFKLGRTPGKSEHTCDFECYKREWNHIVERLGESFGRQPFDIEVSYSEVGKTEVFTLQALLGNGEIEGVVTDRIVGCRITKVEFPNAEDPGPTLVKLTCDPMDVIFGQNRISIDERYDRRQDDQLAAANQELASGARDIPTDNGAA